MMTGTPMNTYINTSPHVSMDPHTHCISLLKYLQIIPPTTPLLPHHYQGTNSGTTWCPPRWASIHSRSRLATHDPMTCQPDTPKGAVQETRETNLQLSTDFKHAMNAMRHYFKKTLRSNPTHVSTRPKSELIAVISLLRYLCAHEQSYAHVQI